MNADLILVFLIIAGAIVLFAMEKMPVDLTAIIVMAALLLTGIITPEEGIAGFSNTATITVGAMFVLSAGLFNSGALNFFTSLLRKLIKKSYKQGLFVLMLFSGVISAFINNTAHVALFMPVVISVARAVKISPSKLLMPLSFSVILGGVCTLIGTSTNILASAIVQQNGLRAFNMFEMAPVGIVLLVVGILYMLFIGEKLLPDRGSNLELTDDFEMSEYITEVVLLPNAKSVGEEIQNSHLVKDVDLDILEIQREDGKKEFPSSNAVLRANDILKVRCNIEKLKSIQSREGIVLKSEKKFHDVDLSSKEARLIEVVITPQSRLIGRTIKRADFRSLFGATVLAIRHRGETMREKIGNTTLLSGDVLLVEVKKDWLPQFKRYRDFIIISDLTLIKVRKSKILISSLIIASVVLVAAFNIMPIVSSAIAGCVLLILTGCISLEDAYRSIDWKVIFLLAGLVTLGTALDKSGGTKLIASFLIGNLGSFGNYVLVSAFYLISMGMTAFMSNNASVALLIPIAIVTAEALGINARPFIMAVTFAASTDFMTPIGYQTNTMIFGPGNYKFSDYLKIGTPLNILCWILGSILIPYFFPF
jgi:di/tricarboxylate transporter